MPAGPDVRVKITKEYAKHVARDAFFWVWLLINVYNKRLGAEKFLALPAGVLAEGGSHGRVLDAARSAGGELIDQGLIGLSRDGVLGVLGVAGGQTKGVQRQHNLINAGTADAWLRVRCSHPSDRGRAKRLLTTGFGPQLSSAIGQLARS
jgi:hypothetical protein